MFGERKKVKQSFELAKEKVIGIDRQKMGIGTLSEKTVHAVFKNFYEPDEDYQEIPIGSFVADIYRDGKIIEIQTRQFNKMRDKLSFFLPQYQVTIVHPIPYMKYLSWLDEETGALSERRKSPKKGSFYEIFPELYKIKMFLKDPNLCIKPVLVNMDEIKSLNGFGKQKKIRATRYDRIPISIEQEIELCCPQDYMQFIPVTLDEFSIKEFAREAHITVALAQSVVPILYHMGVITRIGKQGNAYIYKVIDL